MKEIIQNRLKLVNESIDWINNSLKGNEHKNAYNTMRDCRRNLNKKKYALEDNPAAAVFGQSQVGKSYLIGNLLSEDIGSPFKFKILDKNQTEIAAYDFIEDINPSGGGSESTSLVSRFSTKYVPFNSDYPIKAKLLTPADLVLILCDSFYHDINVPRDQKLQKEDVNDAVIEMKNKWNNRKEPLQPFLTEDHIMDIKQYFNDFGGADNISDFFFEEIAQLIAKVKPEEWQDIFSLLWNKNGKFTNLFSDLINWYQKLNFVDTLYLPIEAVLNKHGTLLDVKRFKEIEQKPENQDSDFRGETDLLFIENDSEKVVKSFPKSYLCALSAELVFSLPETLLERKPFLKETDILDFPGSRARKTTSEGEIQQMYEYLTRGKVAYLFNKYSVLEKINILLLCAVHTQPSERAMPELLASLVNRIIGSDSEIREKNIEVAKISPLFIIGTYFNQNLDYDFTKDKKESNKKYRWDQRFDDSLAIQLVDKKIHKWFENWTTSQKYFNNIYLLRDYKYSKQIFNSANGKETTVIENDEKYPLGFMDKLRQSFLDHQFVKNHFGENAEKSWDSAASPNEDGTQLIIDNLTIVANNINPVRLKMAHDDINKISQTILAELVNKYDTSDKETQIQTAKSVAGDIQNIMAVAFGSTYIKDFGPLMKELMLDEGSVVQLYRDTIADLKFRDDVNRDKYSIYRIEVPVREEDKNDGPVHESYFQRMCVKYEKITDEEKEKYRETLKKDGIILKDLIAGNTDLIKNKAQQLADVLLIHWYKHVVKDDKQNIQRILTKECPKTGKSALEEIRDRFEQLFKKLRIAKRIAEKIQSYVEGCNKTELPYGIIADISAELLNKCINTVGLEYLDESERSALEEANKKNQLNLVFDQRVAPAKESVENLLTKIKKWTERVEKDSEEVKTLPNYRNFLSWSDHLKIGFVYACDIPTYNVDVNEKLGIIINEYCNNAPNEKLGYAFKELKQTTDE